jgi:hypothetical protein
MSAMSNSVADAWERTAAFVDGAVLVASGRRPAQP